jgi:carboxypeptidase Taq
MDEHIMDPREYPTGAANLIPESGSTQSTPMTSIAPPFEQLRDLLTRSATLGEVGRLVAWDQETKMPKAGATARAEQMALLAGLLHERGTSTELGELLGACEEDSELTADEATAADLREARRDFDRATRLPTDLVTDLARVGSKSQHAWKEARANSDFAIFQPWFEELLVLMRHKAECHGVAPGGELYDNLIDEFEPGATAASMEAVFSPLRPRLSALISEVAESRTPPSEAPLHVHVPAERQHEFGLFVLGAMGFDLDAGRLDITTHPFCQGVAAGDTRLTTRYNEERFADALYGTMHEGGHGIYEQGLPKARHHGLPGSQATSLGMHESQSRLWENLVGRSRAFCTWALPHAQRILGGAFENYGPDDLFRAVNSARPSFIRVEADESTYNLHVMLRFDIERSLLRGDLEPADVPATWNEKVNEYLGIEVPNDAQGCLQDVHWSFGLFGYFPTYCMGNLYASQLWEAAERDLGTLAPAIERGEFSGLRGWLNEKVHAHGRRLSAAQICESATGASLSADPMMRHLEGKIRPIYGI